MSHRLASAAVRSLVAALTVCAVFSGETAAAAATTSAPTKVVSAIVRVNSYLCATRDADSNWWRGSGLLIELNGVLHVLTSSHVVVSQLNAGGAAYVCGQIETKDGTKLTATTVAHDALRDLALLRIDAANDTGAVTRTLPLALARADLDAGPELDYFAHVYMFGLPVSQLSAASPTGTVGTVINPRSSQIVLDQPYMTEIDGTTMFGMSGGPVVQQDGHFAGLLSQQVLAIFGAGQPARATSLADVERYAAAGTHYPVVSLAIPARFVAAWVDDVLAGRNRNFWIGSSNSNSMAMGTNQLYSYALVDGVQFMTYPCVAAVPASAGGTGVGGQGAGVGGQGAGVGGQNAGIGGQGAGVGGQNIQGGTCRLSLEPAFMGNSTPWPWPDKAETWKAVRQDLLSHQRRMWVTKLKSPDGREAPVESLIQVLALIRDGYTPQMTDQLAGQDSGDAAMKLVQQSLSVIQALGTQEGTLRLRADLARTAASLQTADAATRQATDVQYRQWVEHASWMERSYIWLAATTLDAKSRLTLSIIERTLIAQCISLQQEYSILRFSGTVDQAQAYLAADSWRANWLNISPAVIAGAWTAFSPEIRQATWGSEAASPYARSLVMSTLSMLDDHSLYAAWTPHFVEMENAYLAVWRTVIASKQTAAYWTQISFGDRSWITNGAIHHLDSEPNLFGAIRDICGVDVQSCLVLGHKR